MNPERAHLVVALAVALVLVAEVVGHARRKTRDRDPLGLNVRPSDDVQDHYELGRLNYSVLPGGRDGT